MDIKNFEKLTKSEFKRVVHQMVSRGYIITKIEQDNKRYSVVFCGEVS